MNTVLLVAVSFNVNLISLKKNTLNVDICLYEYNIK